MTVKSPGRPPGDAAADDELKKVTFKADEETLEAIRFFEGRIRLPSGGLGRGRKRSEAIRGALIRLYKIEKVDG